MRLATFNLHEQFSPLYCPGCPEVISGNDLLARFEVQAGAYGAEIIKARADALEPTPDGFAVMMGDVTLADQS